MNGDTAQNVTYPMTVLSQGSPYHTTAWLETSHFPTEKVLGHMTPAVHNVHPWLPLDQNWVRLSCMSLSPRYHVAKPAVTPQPHPDMCGALPLIDRPDL